MTHVKNMAILAMERKQKMGKQSARGVGLNPGVTDPRPLSARVETRSRLTRLTCL